MRILDLKAPPKAHATCLGACSMPWISGFRALQLPFGLARSGPSKMADPALNGEVDASPDVRFSSAFVPFGACLQRGEMGRMKGQRG